MVEVQLFITLTIQLNLDRHYDESYGTVSLKGRYVITAMQLSVFPPKTFLVSHVLILKFL